MSEATLPRICVFFPGALGDFICFLPALQDLAQSTQVDLFARTEFGGLVPPQVRVRSLECLELRQLFVAASKDEERWDNFFSSYMSVYSWTGSGQRDFVRRLEGLSQGRARIYPFRPVGALMHQTDYYCSCVGESNQGPRLPMVVPQADAVAWGARYWAKHSLAGKAVLVLGPGSGAKEKNWPPAFYYAVAQWWRHVTQGVVVVLLGPVEEERGGLHSLLDDALVARDLNLAQVVALLVRSNLYLGNDSGVTHLAAAAGVRSVALFGPSDWEQWAPRGPRVTILSRKIDCSPCAMQSMKRCPHRKCLTALYPRDVIEELEILPEVIALTRGGVGITV